MSERIREPPLAESVGLIGDWGHLDRAACDRPGSKDIGVGDQQVDPHRRAMEALWTQVRGCWRLFSHAESGISYRQLYDNRAVRVGVAVHHFGAESPFVEGDCVRRPRAGCAVRWAPAGERGLVL